MAARIDAVRFIRIPVGTLALATYTVAIGGAEIIFIVHGALVGAISHGLLVPIMLGHYLHATATRYPGRPTAGTSMRAAPAFPALALIPLLRLLSLTMVSELIPTPYWYALVAIPLLAGTVMAIQVLGIGRRHLGLVRPTWRADVIMGLTGLPFGLAGYLALRPDRLVSDPTWQHVLLGVFLLFGLASLAEELLFRGLIQHLLGEILGDTAIIWVALLSAVMYLSAGSVRYVLVMAAVGLFLGWYTRRYRSLWGPVLAHGSMLFSMGFLWSVVLEWGGRVLDAPTARFVELSLWVVSAVAVGAALLALLHDQALEAKRTQVGDGSDRRERSAPTPTGASLVAIAGPDISHAEVARAEEATLPAPAGAGTNTGRQRLKRLAFIVMLTGMSLAVVYQIPRQQASKLPASGLTNMTPASDLQPSPDTLASPGTTRSPSQPATPSPSRTAGPSHTAEAALQRVAAAESAVQSGEFRALIDYGKGTRVEAIVLFDLGGETGEPRLKLTTTYSSIDSHVRMEHIQIGARSWQRQDGGAWALIGATQEVWGQIQALLPRAESVEILDPASNGQIGRLVWHDPGRGSDVTLTVDPESGIPSKYTASTPARGTTFTVIYQRWGVPVDIKPPPDV